MWTLALLAACGDKPASSTATPAAPTTVAHPDVVLVTLDTTRADRIGAYGYVEARTPTIDSFAHAGIRFERAISPLPLTIPAHASLFTGLYPYHTHIRSNGDNVLGADFTTLAEHFQAAGYHTAASVAAYVTTRQWGFAQGFETYYDSMPEPDGGATSRNFWHTERGGDEVVDDALAWLAQVPRDKPLFLWVHLYDAHAPYVARDAYKPDLADRPYDAELAFVDDQLRRLRNAFEGRDVLWSLVGDHGESLGEHGEATHGLFTFDATQHVPWILSGANVSPAVVREVVSTVSMTPTLLRLAGIPVPDGLDAPAQPSTTPTQAYAESYQLADRYRIAPHRTIVEGAWKLIATPRPELYDVVTDPTERTNVAEAHPDVVAALRQKLDALGATPPGGAAAMDAETMQQLASLGYLGGGGTAGVDFAALPDPKDRTEFLRGTAALERGDAKGEGKETRLGRIDVLLAAQPDAFELRMRKATLLGQLGRTEEARAFVEETAARFPEQTRPWVVLSNGALATHDTRSAVEFGRRALEAGPTDVVAQETLLDALFRDKQTEEALKLARAWMAANPSNPGVAALLGRYYLAAHDLKNAETNLRIAASSANPRRGARVELAAMGVAAKQPAAAYELLRAELRDYPGSVLARRILVRLLIQDRNWSEARTELVVLSSLRPREVVWVCQRAQMEFNLADYKAARKTLDSALTMAPDDPDVVLLHANVLVKEGKSEEGQRMWERASKLNEAREQAAAAPKKGGPAGGATP